MCKFKIIIITLTTKVLKSYHTTISYTLLENYNYDLEHLTQGKRFFDLLYGVYSKHSLSLKISTSL